MRVRGVDGRHRKIGTRVDRNAQRSPDHADSQPKAIEMTFEHPLAHGADAPFLHGVSVFPRCQAPLGRRCMKEGCAEFVFVAVVVLCACGCVRSLGSTASMLRGCGECAGRSVLGGLTWGADPGLL